MSFNATTKSFKDYVNSLPAATENDLSAGNNMPLTRSGDVKKLPAEVFRDIKDKGRYYTPELWEFEQDSLYSLNIKKVYVYAGKKYNVRFPNGTWFYNAISPNYTIFGIRDRESNFVAKVVGGEPLSYLGYSFVAEYDGYYEILGRANAGVTVSISIEIENSSIAAISERVDYIPSLFHDELAANVPLGIFLQGTIAENGSYVSTSMTRVCSGVFVCEGIDIAKFVDGYKVLVRYFNNDGTIGASSKWQSTEKPVVLDKNYKYARFVFSKLDDSNIVRADVKNDFKNLIAYKKTDRDVSSYDPVELTTTIPAFEKGSLSSFFGNTGLATTNDDNVRSASFFFAGCYDKLTFSIEKDGFVISLFFYDYDRNYTGRTQYAKSITFDAAPEKCRVKILVSKEIPDGLDSATDFSQSISVICSKSSEKSKRCIDLQNRIFGINSPYAPKISGHRGSIIDAPENSIPSFTLAGKRGYWACESDVHKTKDGVYVMIHDDTLNRTTTGAGYVSDFTYEQLKQLKLTNGIGHNAELYSDDELRIPTFDQYLSICRKYGMVAFIEIKLPDVQSLKDVILKVEEYGLQEQVVLSSGDDGILRNARFLCDYPVWLISATETHYPKYFAMAGAAMALPVLFDDIDDDENAKSVIRQMVSKRMKCSIRACDTLENAEKALELGLSCFNTNALKPTDFDVMKSN